MKRVLSLLLALILVVGLMPPLTASAGGRDLWLVYEDGTVHNAEEEEGEGWRCQGEMLTLEGFHGKCIFGYICGLTLAPGTENSLSGGIYMDGFCSGGVHVSGAGELTIHFKKEDLDRRTFDWHLYPYSAPMSGWDEEVYYAIPQKYFDHCMVYEAEQNGPFADELSVASNLEMIGGFTSDDDFPLVLTKRNSTNLNGTPVAVRLAETQEGKAASYVHIGPKDKPNPSPSPLPSPSPNPGTDVVTKMIKATYTGTKITLNGTTITPKDANGKVVEPFAVNGTTYLPVRAVAGALGLNVDWDQATKTIKLTSDGTPQTGGGTAQAGKVGTETITAVYTGTKITMDGKPIQLADANGGAVEPFAVAGTTYLPIRAISNALGLNVEWVQSTKTIILATSDLSRTVYITPTGKRYHYNSSCNGGTYTASTLAYALQKGLTPCDKCVLLKG